MYADNNGSYLREPSVSEGTLKTRIESLMADVPLNANTVIERNQSLDSEVPNINTNRAKKELEASLGHEVGRAVSVTARYNPNWHTFDISHLKFALPGTTSLTAHTDFDPQSDSYSSYLYDDVSSQQIPRKPVQTSTINTLLKNGNFSFTSNTAIATQDALLTELFKASPGDMDLTIRQSAVLIKEEIADIVDDMELANDMYGVCSIERTQTYSDEDILDVIEFVNQVCMAETKHARVIKVITSQNGSTITGEEITTDEITGQTEIRSIEFDYNMLEMLLAHVDKARASLGQ